MKFLKGIAVMTGVLILTGTAAAANCEHGSPVSGSFYVKGSDIDFRRGPGQDHARIINQKATKALGSTIYHTLWSSMVLEGRCETAEWLQARIVKTDGRPVNGMTGWVHKRFVASEPSPDMKAGLLWDIDSVSEFTEAEKKIVRRGALKVLKDEANCAGIIDGFRSGSRQGAFFVTCNAGDGGGTFNVWFTPAEVESRGTLAIPDAYPAKLSRRACEEAITARVLYASTLDIHHFLGYATEVHNNGNRTVIQEFSAKNGFGLELDYRARCLIQPDGVLEITIAEKG